MNKAERDSLIKEYLNVNTITEMDAVLNDILNNTGRYDFIEVIEKKQDDNYESRGYIIFKFQESYYKVKFHDYSYGDFTVDGDSLETVIPIEKTILVFE